MKTGFVIVAMTFGLLAGAMTGASLAGDAENVSPAYVSSADPEGAAGQAWLGQGPIETGALPDASRSDRIASGDEGFTFIEAGGLRYRASLDTGA